MNPKFELCLAMLVLIATSAGLWAIVHDIRRGETTHANWWRPRILIYRREKKPADFWGLILYSVFAVLLGFGLGVWALYDALQKI